MSLYCLLLAMMPFPIWIGKVWFKRKTSHCDGNNIIAANWAKSLHDVHIIIIVATSLWTTKQIVPHREFSSHADTTTEVKKMLYVAPEKNRVLTNYPIILMPSELLIKPTPKELLCISSYSIPSPYLTCIHTLHLPVYHCLIPHIDNNRLRYKAYQDSYPIAKEDITNIFFRLNLVKN